MKTFVAHPIVLVLAVLYTLYFASEFIIPIVAALVLMLAFSPLTKALARRRIPRPVSGFIIVGGLTAVFTVGLWQLSDSALEWLARSPTMMNQIEYRLREIKEPVKQVKEASKKVQKMTEMDDDTPTQRDIVVKPPSLFENLFGTMRTVLIQFTVSMILLLLLLSSGNMFKRKLLDVLSDVRTKRRSLMMWKKIEHDISSYIYTVSIINLGFGVTVASALHLFGMPNAILWGVMAALLNFMPYIGALVGLVVITMVSIVTFDTIGQALVVPAIYGTLNLIEAQFFTPVVLGNRLSLNFVVVFVSVLFWGWLWNAPGAVLAVPLLIVAKVICENSIKLRPFAIFLAFDSNRRISRAVRSK